VSAFFRLTMSSFKFLTCLALGAVSIIVSDLSFATDPTPASSASASTQTKTPWSKLSSEQKTALAPLQSEWEKLDEPRKQKWLLIASKYNQQKPEEQQRFHERVRAWVALSPAQKMQVRDNFARAEKITPEKRSLQWQEYQQLSDEKKQELASQAKAKKTVTNLPPETQRNTKPVPPIKKPAAPVVNSGASSASSTNK
jgi:hypothetical protein